MPMSTINPNYAQISSAVTFDHFSYCEVSITWLVYRLVWLTIRSMRVVVKSSLKMSVQKPGLYDLQL